jgi:hypothetical protein
MVYGDNMINQPGLFQLYQSMTGKSVYVQENIVPAMFTQPWQSANIMEYAFLDIEVD